MISLRKDRDMNKWKNYSSCYTEGSTYVVVHGYKKINH